MSEKVWLKGKGFKRGMLWSLSVLEYLFHAYMLTKSCLSNAKFKFNLGTIDISWETHFFV